MLARAAGQGGHVYAQAQPRDPNRAAPAGAQPAPAAPAAQRQASAPAGAAPAAIFGATVGMAINQAIGILKDTHPGATLESYYATPDFSRDLHVTASDILRVSAMLEKGKLAHSAKDRNDPEFLAKQEADRKSVV